METGRIPDRERPVMTVQTACMEKKVAGGKFVRISIYTEMGQNKVIISGDFFIHPEEAIFIIENTLSRLSGNEADTEVEHILEKVIAENGAELIGLDIPTITKLYKGALHVESTGAQLVSGSH